MNWGRGGVPKLGRGFPDWGGGSLNQEEIPQAGKHSRELGRDSPNWDGDSLNWEEIP